MRVPKSIYLMAAFLLILFYTACKKETQENVYLVSTYAGGKSAGPLSGNIDSVFFAGPYNLVFDANSNIYFTDLGNHILRKITPQGRVTILAGEGNSFADGVGSAAKFNTPLGIAVGAGGDVFVADKDNQRIRKVSPEGVVSTLAGNGSIGSADGMGNAAQFFNPVSVAIDAQGNVYVADSENHRIRKITPNGMVSTLAGTTRGFADGAANVSRFNDPVALAIDGANNIYVVDRNNNSLRKITPDGMVTTLAGNGKAGFTNGIGEKVQFNSPRGIAIDKEGNVYIADSGNNSVRKMAPDGHVSTVAGNGSPGFADGFDNKAQFNDPWGLTIDLQNDFLYVADRNNLRIRKIKLK